MAHIDPVTREFINRFQGDFPLQKAPYKKAGESLGISESACIALVQRLLQERILSRFGPIFDAQRMGGGLTLAAMRVPESDFDRVCTQVNQFDEVAHNYRREHELNMWFVVATSQQEAIGDTLAAIEETTALPVYDFPKLQEFYLGLWLEIAADGQGKTKSIRWQQNHQSHVMDSLDRKIVAATQSGLPLVAEPWEFIAHSLGTTAPEVLRRLEAMRQSGIIRRVGAIPNHYRLGFTANGMTVWNIDDDKLATLGPQVGALDFVSHCYARPRHLPLWPYNLFAMVHGHSRDEVEQKHEQIRALLGSQCLATDCLFSSKILKKTGLKIAA